ATAAAMQAAEAPQGRRAEQLQSIGKRIQEALSDLVRRKLVTGRRSETSLEVEIQSDILFASGVAVPSAVATETVRRLAGVLRDEPNAVRVEGYTDDVPIRTAAFPTNWELSAARAASVVHVLSGEGIDPGRLAVVGYGEHQPIADNASIEGRNANRRVLLVILAAPQGVDAVPYDGPEIALDPPPAGTLDPATASASGAAAAETAVAASAAPDSHAGAH